MVDQQAGVHTGNGDGRARTSYPGNGAGTTQSQRRSEPEHPYSNESIPAQVRGLAHDMTTLFSQEMQLARAEVQEALNGLKAGMASLSIGAGFATAGLLITLMGAVYGLGTVLALWMSALIVGVASLIVGVVCLKAGQKKIQPQAFKPERTMESMHKDKETAEEAVR